MKKEIVERKLVWAVFSLATLGGLGVYAVGNAEGQISYGARSYGCAWVSETVVNQLNGGGDSIEESQALESVKTTLLDSAANGCNEGISNLQVSESEIVFTCWRDSLGGQTVTLSSDYDCPTP